MNFREWTNSSLFQFSYVHRSRGCNVMSSDSSGVSDLSRKVGCAWTRSLIEQNEIVAIEWVGLTAWNRGIWNHTIDGRTYRYTCMCRPACRIIQTGIWSTDSPRAARSNKGSGSGDDVAAEHADCDKKINKGNAISERISKGPMWFFDGSKSSLWTVSEKIPVVFRKLVRVMGVEETTGSPLEKEIVVLILIFVGILNWTIDLLDLHVAFIPDVFNRFRNVQWKSSYVPQTETELNGEIHAPLLKAHVQIRSKNLRAFSENSTKKDVRRHNTICIDKSNSHGEAKFLHLSHYPDIGRLSLITWMRIYSTGRWLQTFIQIAFSISLHQTKDAGSNFVIRILSLSNAMIYTTTTTTTIRKTVIIAITILAFLLDGVHSFQSARMPFTPSRATLSTALLGEKSSFSENMSQGQQESEEVLFGGEAVLDYARDLPTDDQISNSLNQKLKELEYGIGKRYRIRTQKGFLNVHHEVSATHIYRKNQYSWILQHESNPILSRTSIHKAHRSLFVR